MVEQVSGKQSINVTSTERVRIRNKLSWFFSFIWNKIGPLFKSSFFSWKLTLTSANGDCTGTSSPFQTLSSLMVYLTVSDTVRGILLATFSFVTKSGYVTLFVTIITFNWFLCLLLRTCLVFIIPEPSVRLHQRSLYFLILSPILTHGHLEHLWVPCIAEKSVSILIIFYFFDSSKQR